MAPESPTTPGISCSNRSSPPNQLGQALASACRSATISSPQQHGGTITVESKPGEFTEFAISLPRHGRTRTSHAARLTSGLVSAVSKYQAFATLRANVTIPMAREAGELGDRTED